MNRERNRVRASYVQTLIYYDGPILALFQNSFGTPIVALAVKHKIEGFSEPFIAKRTTSNIFSQYMDQRVDLGYVFRSPKGGDPYLFDWDQLEDGVSLIPIERLSVDGALMMPGTGIFSRNHTEVLSGTRVAQLVRHAYKIDGRWSANDFSLFYSKLADLYALFSFMEEMKRSSGALGLRLASMIANYPWQGGGSYLNFFRDIATNSNDEYPLQVSKIQYASPGSIEVKGIPESLGYIDAVIYVFDRRKSDLREIYKTLRKVLESEGLLGSDIKDFSNNTIETLAKRYADDLLRSMNVGDPEIILSACRNHLVTYSKIALAVYRRGEALHQFHEQGRLALPS